MNQGTCPTCGAPLNSGKCAKCNSAAPTEISRSFVKPVSYVAPTAQAPGATAQRAWTAPTMEDAITIRRIRERSKRKTRIVTAIVVFAIALVGYEIYGFFIRQASSYGGYYWNDHQCFAMNFPQTGWSHYRKSQLSSLPFENTLDGFYMGKDPDSPEVLMALWTTFNRNGFSDSYVDANDEVLAKQASDEINSHLAKNSYSFDMRNWEPKTVGGNHGFLLRGDVQKGVHSYQALVYCGYNQHTAFLIPFLGSSEKMEQQEAALDELMHSFVFKGSLF